MTIVYLSLGMSILLLTGCTFNLITLRGRTDAAIDRRNKKDAATVANRYKIS